MQTGTVYATERGDVTYAELKSFVHLAATEMKKVPGGEKAGNAAVKMLAMGGGEDHWPLAAAVYRDSGLPPAGAVTLLCSKESTERVSQKIGNRTAASASKADGSGFVALVTQHVNAGKDRSEAIAAAVKESPDLHRQYLAACNGRDGGNIPPKRTATATPGGDPVAAFTAAVAEKRKDFPSEQEAIAAVVRESPELHRSYVAAVNRR